MDEGNIFAAATSALCLLLGAWNVLIGLSVIYSPRRNASDARLRLERYVLVGVAVALLVAMVTVTSIGQHRLGPATFYVSLSMSAIGVVLILVGVVRTRRQLTAARADLDHELGERDDPLITDAKRLLSDDPRPHR